MYPKKKKYRLPFFSLPAFTMAELLIVMLVGGIVFLMVFEGLNIVRQYSNLINRKLMEKTILLCGHQTLEILMEHCDSIRKNDSRIIFYSNAPDTAENCLVIDSTNILLYRGTSSDILFPNPILVDFHFLNEETSLIDSIFIAVRSGKDTLRFDYGLSHFHDIKLNIYSE